MSTDGLAVITLSSITDEWLETTIGTNQNPTGWAVSTAIVAGNAEPTAWVSAVVTSVTGSGTDWTITLRFRVAAVANGEYGLWWQITPGDGSTPRRRFGWLHVT